MTKLVQSYKAYINGSDNKTNKFISPHVAAGAFDRIKHCEKILKILQDFRPSEDSFSNLKAHTIF